MSLVFHSHPGIHRSVRPACCRQGPLFHPAPASPPVLARRWGNLPAGRRPHVGSWPQSGGHPAGRISPRSRVAPCCGWESPPAAPQSTFSSGFNFGGRRWIGVDSGVFQWGRCGRRSYFGATRCHLSCGPSGFQEQGSSGGGIEELRALRIPAKIRHPLPLVPGATPFRGRPGPDMNSTCRSTWRCLGCGVLRQQPGA